MKKLLAQILIIAALAVSSVFVAPLVSATDVCSDTPHSIADFYVENHRVNWLLSQSCVDSEILTTMPVGSVMHVIGKTEGWHKLVTEDGLVGWMWEDYVTPTNKPFNPVSAEPEPEPYVAPEPEPVEYIAMRDIAGHKYEDAIWEMFNKGVVQGYEDGSYKPDNTINRAELIKVVVETNMNDTFADFADSECFTDVKKDQWYSQYVCYAQSQQMIEGYPDGSFKPAQEVNFVEGLKILIGMNGGSYEETIPWYKGLVEFASADNMIPFEITEFDGDLTRGQMAEMLVRVLWVRNDPIDDYLLENAPYRVTYETIEAGLNVEEVLGTGQCIYGSDLYPDGEVLTVSPCADCMCDNGNWLCTGLCIEEELIN